MSVKSVGPVVLLVLTGVGAFALLASSPRCGHDECLRTLFLVVFAVVWSLSLPAVIRWARSGRGGLQALAWIAALGWAPLAWVVALVLFVLVPSLGGA